MSSTEQPNNTNSSQTTSGGLDSLGGVVAAQTQGVANVALGMALNEQNTKTQVAAEEQKKQNQAAAAEIWWNGVQNNDRGREEGCTFWARENEKDNEIELFEVWFHICEGKRWYEMYCSGGFSLWG